MTTDDEAINALRSDVALQIARVIARTDATQPAAARRLGIPQPTLSNIENGRVSGISLELLLRIAARAGLPISLHTGRTPEEAGAFVSSILRAAPSSPRSRVGAAARESVTQAERRLTPSQRLEAFLEHNQHLASLYQAGRAAELRRVRGAEPGA